MCQVESLKQMVYVLAFFKAVFGAYIIYTGAHFVTSYPIQQAYGINFVSIGGSLVVIGLISGCLSFPQVYGVRKHNRFILITLFFFDSIFMSQLINLGVRILHYTVPLYPKDLQLDCLLNTPQLYTPEECAPYLQSDRTAGFRLLWSWLFTTQATPAQFQIMTNAEINEVCCGFFAPMKCSNISEPMPIGHPLTGITPSLVREKLECGPYPGYYTQQWDCTTYFDVTVIPFIVGGCNYDLGDYITFSIVTIKRK